MTKTTTVTPETIETIKESKEIVPTKKQTSILIYGSLVAIIITLGAAVFQYYDIDPKVRELHSLQRRSVSIQKFQKTLEKMQSCEYCNKDIVKTRQKLLNEEIARFNKKMDEIMKTREMYPATEPIPNKINPRKTLAGKKVP